VPTNQLLPISLCIVTYKIVTKIIAKRVKGVLDELVSPHQCSFVLGRHSLNKVVIAQEVFHSMRGMK